ncbi:helix-turn-helix transcriptional regulator [Saccharothrix longispora]|uniref:PAS domain S-box-containing protein n=1 Tax=Saccharothrix longispora TaxID=33920 RepID=A0ABU1PRA1_9PSEU|nr:helix-turn-helix transcriptional regulator [Saccharothrix longispora]MDR6593165.1 PAS domain S-box-containing protein [Saccharothrix longispora]
MSTDMADIAIQDVYETFPAWPSDGGRPDSGRGVYRSFFERSGMCVAHLNRSLRILEANADFYRQFGRGPAELSDREFCDLLHPSVRERLGQQLSRLADGQRPRFADRVVALRPGDSALSGELTGFAVHGEAGRVDSVMVLVRPEKSPDDGHLVSGKAKLLTAMDARILEGVAAGVSTVQLAATLYLSRGGVEYHVSTLLRKLKVKNRPALVSKAYSMGIFGVGSWPPRVLPEYVK